MQSTASLARRSTRSSTAKEDIAAAGDAVNPANLRQIITNPSISSDPPSAAPELTNAPGYRAGEAYVSPAPVTTAGTIIHYNFDLRKCEFTLEVRAGSAPADLPTVVFLPEYHFPKDTCVVEVSSGKWEIGFDEDEAVLLQKLKWWHGDGEQSLKVAGFVRKHNLVDGATDEGGYYEQLNQWAGLINCVII